MQRANVNLIVKREDVRPLTLYYRYAAEEGSDQTLRESLANWLKDASFDEARFAGWIRSSFSHTGEPAEIESLPYPVIYYDAAGFRVPYTFLFDANHEEAIVWRWERRIFRGTSQELALRLTEGAQVFEV